MFTLHGVDPVPRPTTNQRTLPPSPSNLRSPPPHTNPNSSKNDPPADAAAPPQTQSYRARSSSSSWLRDLFAPLAACLLLRRFFGLFSLLPLPSPSLSAEDDSAASRSMHLSLRRSLPDRALTPPSNPLPSNMQGLLATDPPPPLKLAFWGHMRSPSLTASLPAMPP